MEAMDNYSYLSLDLTRQEIRILELHPGFYEDRIECSLTSLIIFEDQNYEALSYTWGNADDVREITLNGDAFQVTANLEVALRHLRRQDVVRRLWVDAICINQANNDERLHQVGQMRLVYQEASRVLVWLGPAADKSDQAFDLISEMAMDERRYYDSSTLSSGFMRTSAIRALYSLLQRSYWNRLWILQEISVASAELLVGCGQKWLPWSKWAVGLSSIEAHVLDWQTRMILGNQLDNASSISDKYWFYQFSGLNRLRNNIQSYAQSEVLSADITRSNFIDLLLLGQGKCATDPRDHIYALLGLVRKPIKVSISPDYSKSVGSVYREAAKFAIEAEDDLEFLRMRNHILCPWLPTWVPNFGANRSIRFPSLSSTASQKLYPWSAGGDFQPHGQPKVSNDMETLIAQGKVVDRINKVVDLNGIRTSPSALVNIVHEMALSGMSRGSSCLEEAVWRSLVGDTAVGYICPCPQDYGAMYTEVVRQATQGLGSPNQESQPRLSTTLFLQAMYTAVCRHRATPHRRFFTTCGGLVGLGTPECVESDTVCILRGYSMPVIMRRQENSYTLLGSAYVHGIMNGEALSHNSSVESDVEFTII